MSLSLVNPVWALYTSLFVLWPKKYSTQFSCATEQILPSFFQETETSDLFLHDDGDEDEDEYESRSWRR